MGQYSQAFDDTQWADVYYHLSPYITLVALTFTVHPSVASSPQPPLLFLFLSFPCSWVGVALVATHWVCVGQSHMLGVSPPWCGEVAVYETWETSSTPLSHHAASHPFHSAALTDILCCLSVFGHQPLFLLAPLCVILSTSGAFRSGAVVPSSSRADPSASRWR